MLIVGLGNIGKNYENTYHNMGFMVVEELAKKLNLSFKDKWCKAECATSFIGGGKLILAKPMTFMNLSGEAVRELIGANHENAENTIVIYDDIDLNVGDIRIRKEGSGGTHNGMRNIVELLGTTKIIRIRMGIGKPSEKMELVNYVLSKISGDNLIKLKNSIQKVADNLSEFIFDKDLDKLIRNCK